MAAIQPEQFSDWSRRLNASEEQAFTELFDHTYDSLSAYLRQFIFDADAAADVLQDMYVKLWQIRDTIDPEKSLRALMYQMVRNQALNYLRSQKDRNISLDSIPQEAHMEEPDHPEPDEQNYTGLLHTKIQEWIQQLPDRQREAFELSRYEGMSHEEIAQVMELQPRTVNNHIVLALNTLRDRLDAFKARYED